MNKFTPAELKIGNTLYVDNRLSTIVATAMVGGGIELTVIKCATLDHPREEKVTVMDESKRVSRWIDPKVQF